MKSVNADGQLATLDAHDVDDIHAKDAYQHGPIQHRTCRRIGCSTLMNQILTQTMATTLTGVHRRRRRTRTAQPKSLTLEAYLLKEVRAARPLQDRRALEDQTYSHDNSQQPSKRQALAHLMPETGLDSTSTSPSEHYVPATRPHRNWNYANYT